MLGYKIMTPVVTTSMKHNSQWKKKHEHNGPPYIGENGGIYAVC